MAIHARNCKEMVFTDDMLHALLAVGCQVAVGEVVAAQALVAVDPGAF